MYMSEMFSSPDIHRQFFRGDKNFIKSPRMLLYASSIPRESFYPRDLENLLKNLALLRKVSNYL